MRRKPSPAIAQAGFTLIVTVITIALVTIMAVAYLSSSSLDRTTARSFANKAKADLAAKAAIDTAISRLTDNILSFPDSATSWEVVNQAGGALQYQGTVLYYREQTPEATAAGTPSPLHMLPLISGAVAVTIPYGQQTASQREANLRSALPTLDDSNSFDLNHARFTNDSKGSIGAPSPPPGPATPPTPPPFRGQWIEQKDSDGKVTSRFAYWMEDESFKTNVNLMGKTARGGTSLGNDPSQIPLQGMMKGITPAADPSAIDELADAIFTQRGQFPGSQFFDYGAINQGTGLPTLSVDAKFESTIFSGSSNLSRSGSKRVNLNKVVVDSNSPSEIRKQLDEIIKTISFHLPNFGQRFYRSGSNLNSTTDVSSANQTIYLNKIAANIRDYIDTDSQPTIVKDDFSIMIGTAPTNAITTNGTAGPNEVVAIGKERVPFIQEYALRVREVAFAPRTGAFANYQINIDHYVEFWNMSNHDIQVSDLGPSPFLLIANQPGWDAGTKPQIPPGPTRDLKLLLSTATNSSSHAPLTSFPAGSATVITTDPTLLPALTPDPTRVYFIQVTPDNNGITGPRTYSGQTDRKGGNGSELRLNMIDRTTSSSDYETEIALGNNLGILESAWGAAAISSAISVNVDTDPPPQNRLDDTKFHFRGASLRGNLNGTTPNATTGDPRTNAEQLRFDLNGASANNDKTRYFSTGLDSNSIPANESLGAPNSAFVDPSKWPDYSSSTQSANGAPAVVANAPLTSIGQLGDIFDPVRVKGDSNDINLSRSGGRTLQIGQPNRFSTTNPTGLWDGNSNAADREWTAWRLLDVFSTTDLVQLDGRINVNGVNRDGGIALKSALYKYDFQASPDSDPSLSSQPLDDNAINSLIEQIKARVINSASSYSEFSTTTGPLAEPGELSEMPIFNSTSDGSQSFYLVPGINPQTTNDRGREELFRRLVGLITTRGNIFTIYSVGQSLSPQQGTTVPVVTGTSQLRITFRIDPVWNAGTPSEPFDPTAITRFIKPDKYEIKILYAGD